MIAQQTSRDPMRESEERFLVDDGAASSLLPSDLSFLGVRLMNRNWKT